MRPLNLTPGILAAVFATGPAIASVLIFDIDGLGNHGVIPQAYGDRVGAADEGI